MNPKQPHEMQEFVDLVVKNIDKLQNQIDTIYTKLEKLGKYLAEKEQHECR
jgi:cell division septum initiation protein DivIVA